MGPRAARVVVVVVDAGAESSLHGSDRLAAAAVAASRRKVAL